MRLSFEQTVAEGGGGRESPERGEGTQGRHGDGPTLWQVEEPRSAGDTVGQGGGVLHKGWRGCPVVAALRPDGGLGRQRMKQGQNKGHPGCRGPVWGCKGVVIASISKAVTPRLFQFFAFITTLLYILHAFSIYYH